MECARWIWAEASMRPGQSQAWLNNVKERVLSSVSASKAQIICHTGNWQHDLDQVLNSVAVV